MPYYITKTNPDCSGWAVEDEAGEAFGCHQTKADAIDQAIAISLSTDEPFEGERAAVDSLQPGDYVSWDVNNPKILAEVVMANGGLCAVEIYEFEDGVYSPTEKLVIMNVFALTKVPRPALVAEKPMDVEPTDVIDESVIEEDRAINQEAPAYMRVAARRGLEYNADGFGGDGLTEKTIREARDMAEGRVSDDKWIRIAAWIARHLDDLDSPDADPSSDNYPSAGVVAHLLWGSGPSKRAAQRTLAYAEGVVARIRADQERSVMTTDNRAKWADVANRIVHRLEGRALPKHEERVNVIDLEVRETGDGMSFEGYAAVFNSASQDLGGFKEYIAPGAFKRSLQSRNEVKLLWNHDAGEPLASVRGGTLRLTEDDRGLKVQAQLANTSRGRDVAELIRSKTVDSMSFGFSVIKDTWNSEGNVRTLNAVRLFEISLVSFPAYEATAGTVSVRSAQTIDADQLAEALMKLESGEELDPTSATLITDVVAKLTKTDEVQEVEGDILALKKKKLDLLMKEVNNGN